MLLLKPHHRMTPQELAQDWPDECANHSSGYIQIMRHGKAGYLHRVVWEALVGPIPVGFDIDHLNGRPTDNRLENLRCVPHRHNMQNRKRDSRNTSGVTGVTFDKRGQRWCAQWKELGRVRRVGYSLRRYGDAAFGLACQHRQQAVQAMCASGEAYTIRHGC